MNDLFEFQRHAVLRASAGTGKTEALTGQYLRLIIGAGHRPEPIHPRRVVAVTFTEKAAAEMKERIHRALRQIQQNIPDTQALFSVRQIRAALQTKGRTLNRDQATTLLDTFVSARIMTIHALCLSLLREHAMEAGFDPHFEVLEEERSYVILERCVTDLVLERLRQKDLSIDALLVEWSGFNRPRTAQGLVPVLIGVYRAIRESGSDARSILKRGMLGKKAIQSHIHNALGQLEMGHPTEFSVAWKSLIESHHTIGSASLTGAQKAAQERVRKCLGELATQYPTASVGLDDLYAAAALLEDACGKGALKDLVPAQVIRTAVRELWALPRAHDRAQIVVDLLCDLDTRYATYKHEHGLVDYQDLTLGARRVLREHPEVQKHEAAGMEALLVDEFQDTNAAQRDIIQLLVPDIPDTDSNARLFIVGDRKQSIYGFRGADVTVFEDFVDTLTRSGATTTALQTSFRSAPDLLLALNVLSAAVLRPSSEEPSDLSFADWERLEPAPSPHTSSPSQPHGRAVGEILGEPSATLDPETEAAWIASRVQELVSSGTPIVRDGKTLRGAGFRDMALLLPRFTHIQSYLRALQKAGIPFLVGRSAGLMESSEARDLISTAKVLLNAHDTLDLFVVLRSPLCALSDPALTSLAKALKGRVPGLTELGNIPLPHMDQDEGSRFHACIDHLSRLQRSSEILGLGRSLSLLLTACHYGAVAAAMPSPHQKLRNIDRLLEEITCRELGGESSRDIVQDFLRRQRLGSYDLEPATSLGGADVMTVMTVHQAKGLEFPVVFAADLGRQLPSLISPLMFDPTSSSGLAVSLRDAQFRRVMDSQSQHIRDRLMARQTAESKRLFYVQVTRAKDYLILSGKLRGLMKILMQDAIPELLARGLFKTTSHAGASSHISTTPAALVDLASIQNAFCATQPTPRRYARRYFELTVTALSDFALCPRRYRAIHLLHVPQHPRPESSKLETAASADPRERGTWVHQLLENLDFKLAAQSPKRAAADLVDELPGSLQEDVHARLLAFFSGAYIRDLAANGIVHKEIPFALHLAHGSNGTTIHGQIDMVWETEQALELIDYKVTSPKDSISPVDPYAFQLEVYSLALRRAWVSKMPIRRGIQFLDRKVRMPLYLEKPFDAKATEKQIVDLAEQIQTMEPAGYQHARPIAYCHSIGCGYRWLCHPEHVSINVPRRFHADQTPQ